MSRWVLCCLCLTACSKLETEGEMLFVRNDGADLPIWVRGNSASDTLIVLIAGGPGDPSATYVGKATARLESKYGTVYWDQRLGGDAQGNASASALSVDQLVADTSAVIETVRLRYPGKRLFLLSISWGAELAVGYLASSEHQGRIAGWIDVDGSHNWTQNRLNQLDWIETFGQAAIAAGTDVTYWEGAVAFARANRLEPMSLEGLIAARDFVVRAGGFGHFDVDLPSFGLRSPVSLLSVLTNADIVVKQTFSNPQFQKDLSLSDKLPNITIPVQLLWGANDGVVPVTMANEVLTRIGTPAADKSLVIIEDAAHLMAFEKSEELSANVVAFVEAHR